MFCDGCGATVQPGQAFCSKCGKQVVGPLALIQQRPGRVQGHVHQLGILWLAISAFNTIGGVVLYVLANTLLAHLHEYGAPEAPTGFLRPLLSVISIFVLAKAACGFIAGWGLLQREPWAPCCATVLAAVMLVSNILIYSATGLLQEVQVLLFLLFPLGFFVLVSRYFWRWGCVRNHQVAR